MKKIIALLMTALLIAVFSACAPGTNQDAPEPDTTTASTPSGGYSPITPSTPPDESTDNTSSAQDDTSSAQGESSQPDISEGGTSSEAPSVIGKVDYTHRFTTDYDCHCKLVADVTVISSSELDVSVTVDVKLICHQVLVSARNNSGTVVIGDKKFAYSTPALENYESKEVTFDFVTHSRTLTRDADGSLSFTVGASWPFKGTYSGIEIGIMEAMGVISIHPDGSVSTAIQE